ncbi:MAG TPA: sigma-70 family RNA polymerase sigma factor [Terriglobales bacterium]|nr:sigma-70 family RNA polymerase sigma factor [Terriglobales bacterium]
MPESLQNAAGNVESSDSVRVRDGELIRRVLAGERELFHELIRPYEKAVYLTAYSLLQNEADAEEVAQEAVLKAYRKLATFRGDAKFSTWLITIAVNEARGRLRHARLIAFESIDEPADEDSDVVPAVISDWREIPNETLERKEVRDLLRQAMESLPQAYREVFVLRDVEEMNIAETAEALGINEQLVKTRLLRARLMMQKILAPQLKTRRTGFLGFFSRKAGGSWL